MPEGRAREMKSSAKRIKTSTKGGPRHRPQLIIGAEAAKGRRKQCDDIRGLDSRRLMPGACMPALRLANDEERIRHGMQNIDRQYEITTPSGQEFAGTHEAGPTGSQQAGHLSLPAGMEDCNLSVGPGFGSL